MISAQLPHKSCQFLSPHTHVNGLKIRVSNHVESNYLCLFAALQHPRKWFKNPGFKPCYLDCKATDYIVHNNIVKRKSCLLSNERGHQRSCTKLYCRGPKIVTMFKISRFFTQHKLHPFSSLIINIQTKFDFSIRQLNTKLLLDCPLEKKNLLYPKRLIKHDKFPFQLLQKYKRVAQRSN